MEMIAAIGMLIAKANGLKVPLWCWVIWGLWSAAHLAVAWFWTEEGE